MTLARKKRAPPQLVRNMEGLKRLQGSYAPAIHVAIRVVTGGTNLQQDGFSLGTVSNLHR